MHLFFRYGMRERNLCGVKHQSAVGFRLRTVNCSVLPVADNRGVKPVGVRRVNAQLVRAAGERIEINEECAVGTSLAYNITCNGGLAMRVINHLPRTVKRVG